MPAAHCFPPPWTIDEASNACFIVRDSTGQALAYVYFEDEPGRRSDVRFRATAVIGCVPSETARSSMTHTGHRRLNFAVMHNAVLIPNFLSVAIRN